MHRAMKKLPLPLLVLLMAMLVAAAPSRAAGGDSILMVNVADDVIRSGLSLTKLGIAEVGDQYAVGGNFLGTSKNTPERVTLKMVTGSGKSISRTSRLQKTILGNYGFVVFLPRTDGQIKLINISR